MAQPTFRNMNKEIACCNSGAAVASMHRDVDEMRGTLDETALFGIAVSCDGTWQRDFAFLNGIVIVMFVDTGKVIDFEVFHKKCAQCTAWKGQYRAEAYDEFMATHENLCEINLE